MMQTIAGRIGELGFRLPAPSSPAANYVPWVASGRLVFISGQISRIEDGEVIGGIAGSDASAETAKEAARIAALNLLAQLAAATDGRVAAIGRVVRLGVFIAATPDFRRHSEVANGASDLMTAVFGERGSHSRTAIGVASLPASALVEVDALFELAGPA
ncbi:RidA family protein [Labrys sp. KNU-23]|uniref:RidA family protein n=1 Tax=Labrys sp. KNU-23 TaxID=2789216 RepID=UPI0011EBA409|nr:RidA family protein [Labrys sp. KNU-23]QEN87629.1 RidA family protein [Labrys sp. KNU-23]